MKSSEEKVKGKEEGGGRGRERMREIGRRGEGARRNGEEDEVEGGLRKADYELLAHK